MKHELCIGLFSCKKPRTLNLSHPNHYCEWALNRSKPCKGDILIRLQPGGSRLSSTTTATVSSRPATSATPWSQPSSTLPSWQVRQQMNSQPDELMMNWWTYKLEIYIPMSSDGCNGICLQDSAVAQRPAEDCDHSIIDIYINYYRQ